MSQQYSTISSIFFIWRKTSQYSTYTVLYKVRAHSWQVRPKNLFPEIESEGYITRRDQFALRDQIQREKAEKKEKAKAEKENMKKSKPRGVRKTVDKTAQPKRRGRPPKNPPVASVPTEGEIAAGEIEPKIEKTSNKKRERQQSVSTTPVCSPPRKTQATSAMEEEPVVDTGTASASHDTKTDNQSHLTGKSSTPTPSQTSLSKPRRARKSATKAPEYMVDGKQNALDKDPASAEAEETTKNPSKGASRRVRKSSSKQTAVAPGDKQVDMEKPKSPRRRTTRKKEPTPKPAGGDVEEGKIEATNSTRRAKKQQPAKNNQQSSGSKPSHDEPATETARRRPPRLPTKSISLKTEILTYDAVVAKCVELYKECPKVHCSCNSEPVCHKGGFIPQFEDAAPCRLSIYWKTDAVGLKVQDFSVNDGKTWKWTQCFYFATPGMCIQSAILCMTQFVSWCLNSLYVYMILGWSIFNVVIP